MWAQTEREGSSSELRFRVVFTQPEVMVSIKPSKRNTLQQHCHLFLLLWEITALLFLPLLLQPTAVRFISKHQSVELSLWLLVKHFIAALIELLCQRNILPICSNLFLVWSSALISDTLTRCGVAWQRDAGAVAGYKVACRCADVDEPWEQMICS